MIYGRPFGGVITLISNKLRTITETVCCSERFTVVRIADCLLVNVYLPCAGTTDRELLCEDLLSEICSWCEQYNNCNIVIGGDLNVDIDSGSNIACMLRRFIDNCALSRCDELFPNNLPYTYVNHSLNQQSHIDYIFVSTDETVTNFAVLDPDVNFSDHLPLTATVLYTTDDHSGSKTVLSASKQHPQARPNKLVNYLR